MKSSSETRRLRLPFLTGRTDPLEYPNVEMRPPGNLKCGRVRGSSSFKERIKSSFSNEEFQPTHHPISGSAIRSVPFLPSLARGYCPAGVVIMVDLRELALVILSSARVVDARVPGFDRTQMMPYEVDRDEVKPCQRSDQKIDKIGVFATNTC